MAINLLVEASYKDSIWCRQILKAMSDEAAAKRYGINIIYSSDFSEVDLCRLFDSATERKLLFCLCTSINAISCINEQLIANDIHLVLINHSSYDQIENYSSLNIDFSGAMLKTIRYLVSAGRSKIALYGINPNSTTDLIKETTFNNYMKFLLPDYEETAVYYNNASLEECYRQFEKSRGKYNSVICANDIVAISLLNHLKESGAELPKDIFVTSFGDTVLSKICSPSLTNISASLFDIGRQAVYLYSYLGKREDFVSAAIKIHSKLYLRESTDNTPENLNYHLLPRGTEERGEGEDFAEPSSYKVSYYHTVNFYNDPLATEILRVEDLFSCLNEFDFAILCGLLSGEPSGIMADRLYSSQQAISYRIKRMCQIALCENKGELLSLVRKYASAEAIKAYTPTENYRI